jgi:adenylate cyclase
MGWSDSPEEYFKKADELNQKALTLNKNLFCATAMRGEIYLYQRQFERAIETGRRSIELAPSQAMVYAKLAMTLNLAGNFEEAVTMAEEAVRLNPYCQPWYMDYLAWSYLMAGRYEEALATYKKELTRVLKEGGTPLFAHLGLACVYSEMDRVKEAHTHALEVIRIYPTFSLEIYRKWLPYKNPKHLEKLLVSLRNAGLK